MSYQVKNSKDKEHISILKIHLKKNRNASFGCTILLKYIAEFVDQ